jgi:hypothetical protein
MTYGRFTIKSFPTHYEAYESNGEFVSSDDTYRDLCKDLDEKVREEEKRAEEAKNKQ